MFRALFLLLLWFSDGAILDETADLHHTQGLSEGIKEGWKLIISPVPQSEKKALVKRADETLNLTCRIQRSDFMSGNGSLSPTPDHQQFNLAWYLPISPEDSESRVINKYNAHKDSLQLIVRNLRDTDTGEYKCTAMEAKDNPDTLIFTGSLNVEVKPKRGILNKVSACDTNLFLINCTRATSPCCNQLQSIQLSLDVSRYATHPQQYNEIGHLQTTIYTVIGCSMAFMFIITIIVIAICRVHLKRTAMSRYPHPGGLSHETDTWRNVLLDSGNGSGGILVAYNPIEGLHIMSPPFNPPSYSEVMRDHGPPPPYSSTDQIHAPLQPQNSSHRQVSVSVLNEVQMGEEETVVPLLETIARDHAVSFE